MVSFVVVLEFQNCRKNWHNHNKNNTQIVILINKIIMVYNPPLGISNRICLLLRKDASMLLGVSVSHHNFNKKLLSAPLS